MEGKPPKTIAGVALYLVTGAKKDKALFSRIAEAVGVTENTIIKNAN